MKTRYEEIVRTDYIGKSENPLSLGEILKKASAEETIPEGKEQVLLLAVDMQQDFMEGGSLGVVGSCGDAERLSRFIYNNIDKISKITVSLDTHAPQQIFHPCWWVDGNGSHPAPFTIITYDDVKNGLWIPVDDKGVSLEYLSELDKTGRKKLCIWPYHCIQATSGCALENQFANMIYFYSVVKKSPIEKIIKGTIPYTEFYGIIRSEYGKGSYINTDFLEELDRFDKIIIAGEAKDFCVYETLCQILEFCCDREDIQKKIYVLEDCMSGIQEKSIVDEMYDELKKQFKINIVRSTDKFL